ncbi:unnamed protein product [Cutaneotrichosporon oleaginosum]
MAHLTVTRDAGTIRGPTIAACLARAYNRSTTSDHPTLLSRPTRLRFQLTLSLFPTLLALIMVALQFLTLFGLLPALALGAHEPRHVQPHAAAARRSRVQARNPASVGAPPARRGAGSRKRGANGSCRPRPAPAHEETEAPEAVVAAADGDDWQAPAEQPAEQPTEPPAEPPAAQPTQSEWQDPNAAQPEQPASAPEHEGEWKPTESSAAPETWPPADRRVRGDQKLELKSSTCGPCPSSPEAPNGEQWWLDCGLDGAGWAPPHITLDQLKYIDLNGDGIFAPCTQYFDQFYRYGGEFGIPPIMLASIALQESTCRPWLVGGIGEQGLMQLLGPNCDGAPNGNCQDVDFNVRRGAEYLRKRIDEHNGSVLAGLGAYNGWRIGVTAGEVYNMKNEGRCWAQPNLDYMHQMLNGWLQGKEGWKMGKWYKAP